MSVFQRLPTVAVRLIIKYLVDSTTHGNDRYNNHCALFFLSRVWREEAQKVFFKEASLTHIGFRNPYTFRFDIINNAGNPMYNYIFNTVQYVELGVSESEIIEGLYLAENSDAYINKLQFANAHTFKLHINVEDDYDSENDDDEKREYFNNLKKLYNRSLKSSLRKKFIFNIKEFAKWVARIAPNAKTIQIKLWNMHCTHESAPENFADCVFDLFNYDPHFSPKIMHPAYNWDWDIKHQLSELDINWLGNYNNCSEIIKRNAGTLKSLILKFMDDGRFDNVWDFFGYQESIVYPNVHTLHLRNQVYEWVNSKPSGYIDSDYAPFPVLRYLTTSMNYAITDNVLFRGNEKTLESINVSVHKEWLHTLKDIFIHRKCDQIKYVRFKLKPFDFYNSRPSDEPVFKDLTKVLPVSLVKLCFKANPTPTCLLSAGQYSRFIQLRHLNFGRTDLMLEMVCQIASANPGIKEIHGMNYFLDSHFQHKSVDEIVDILSKKYDLADTHFSFAYAMAFANHMGYSSTIKSDIAVCSAVLVRLFPRFKEIYVHPNHRKTVYAKLANEVSLPGEFLDYSSSLDLLFQ